MARLTVLITSSFSHFLIQESITRETDGLHAIYSTTNGFHGYNTTILPWKITMDSSQRDSLPSDAHDDFILLVFFFQKLVVLLHFAANQMLHVAKWQNRRAVKTLLLLKTYL